MVLFCFAIREKRVFRPELEKIARNWDRGNDPYGDPSKKGTKKELQVLRGSGTTLLLMGGTNTDIGTNCHE